jgi:hypothetical protein
MSEAASAAPLLVSSAASAAFEAVSFAGRGYCVDLDKVFIVRIFSVLCMAAISVLRMAAVSASYGFTLCALHQTHSMHISSG